VEIHDGIGIRKPKLGRIRVQNNRILNFWFCQAGSRNLDKLRNEFDADQASEAEASSDHNRSAFATAKIDKSERLQFFAEGADGAHQFRLLCRLTARATASI
jgi:hypothetical protein